MKKRLFVLVLCVAMVFSMFGCGTKKTSHDLDAKETTDRHDDDVEVQLGGNPVQALRVLGKNSGFRNAMSELELTSSTVMEDATFHRLQQYYQGVPVYGRTVAYVTGESDELLTLVGNVQDVDESISMTPVLQEEDLESIAAQYLNDSYICGTLLWLAVDDVELCVFSSDSGDRLSYSMTISFAGDVASGYYDMVIDAIDGSVLMTDNRLKSVDYISGPLSGQKTIYPNVEYAGSDTVRQLYDPNRGITAYTATQEEIYVYEGSVYGYPVDSTTIITISDFTGSGEPVVWESDEAPDPVAVDAYVNTQITYDYFESVLGNASTDGNGKNTVEIYTGMVYAFDTSSAQFINFYKNAASSTNMREGVTQLFYGLSDEGSSIDAALSLDVVAHEYMHGVEGCHSNMFGEGESGALKEALSDIFGELAEAWHHEAAPNWINMVRNMKNPAANNLPEFYGGENWSNPDDISGFIHNNSTVISHAAYLMWASGAFNETELAQLWYRAMLMMPWQCNFAQCRTLIELAARTMEMSEEQQLEIAIAFDSVGIFEPEIPQYLLTPNGVLTVLDANDEPYDDYTIVVRQQQAVLGTNTETNIIQCLPSLFPTMYPVVNTISVSSPDPVCLDMTPGVYLLELIDNADSEKSTDIIVQITKTNSEDSLTIYTDFGDANAASIEYSMQEYTRTITTTDGVDVYVYHLVYPLFEGNSPAEVLLNEGYARILEEWSGDLDWSPDALYEEWEDNLDRAAFPFTEDLQGEVTYNGNGCFSLVETGYFWSGGAHPNHYTNNYLFDIATGEELTLNQILVGSDEEIDEVLMHYSAAFNTAQVDINHLKNNCSFALTEDGLVFHYQDPIMYRVQGDILIPYTNDDLYVISAGELIRKWTDEP